MEKQNESGHTVYCRSYGAGGNGPRKPTPMINVKAYDYPAVHELADRFPDLDRSEVERMHEIVYRAMQQDFWDFRAPDIAFDVFSEELFGQRPTVYGAGRMGGWLYVDELPPVETWTSTMVELWEEFRERIEAEVDYRQELDCWLRWIEANGTAEAVKDCSSCGQRLPAYA